MVQHRELTPVWILGHGSSGTSIMSRLMREYLKVCYGTESQFMAHYYRRLDRYGDLNDDQNLKTLIDHILQERFFERCHKKWEFRTDVETIFQATETRNYRGVLDAIFLTLAAHLGTAPRWGDKTPEYRYHLDMLRDLFPEAKYIHLIRDGRDVALSVIHRYWGPKNVYVAAHDWKHSCDQIDPFMDALPAEQRMEVTYEQLLSDPVPVFERLIEFLNIDPEGGQLLERISEPLTNDLNRGNWNKWKSGLTEKQIREYEQIAGDALARHGYETTYSPADAPRPTAWRHVHRTLDNKIRKLGYWDYWKDNAYKVRVRTRNLFRGLSG